MEPSSSESASASSSSGPSFLSGLSSFDKSALNHVQTVERSNFVLGNAAMKKEGLDTSVNLLILSKLMGPSSGFHHMLHPSLKKTLLTTKKTMRQIYETPDSVTARSFTHVVAIAETSEEYPLSAKLEFVAYELHQQEPFTHVIALGEEDLIRAAKLRKLLDIPAERGQGLQSALLYRDKVMMKKRLSAAGIKVPYFAEIESSSDLIFFFKDPNNFPAVLKPTKGCGSVNTCVIRSMDDVKRIVSDEQSLTRTYCDSALGLEVERFVHGRMYHIDGIVYNGEAKLIWPSAYLTTVMNFNTNRFVAGVSLHPSNPLTRPLQEFTARVIEALKTSDAPACHPFHAEAWVSPDDSSSITLCEIASRAGGGEINLQTQDCHGIDMDLEFCLWQAGQRPHVKPDRLPGLPWQDRTPMTEHATAWLFVYPKIGHVLSSIPADCPLPFVLAYQRMGVQGQRFDSRSSCADAVCSFLMKCESQPGQEIDIAESLVDKAIAWFDSHAQWEVFAEDKSRDSQ